MWGVAERDCSSDGAGLVLIVRAAEELPGPANMMRRRGPKLEDLDVVGPDKADRHRDGTGTGAGRTGVGDGAVRGAGPGTRVRAPAARRREVPPTATALADVDG